MRLEKGREAMATSCNNRMQMRERDGRGRGRRKDGKRWRQAGNYGRKNGIEQEMRRVAAGGKTAADEDRDDNNWQITVGKGGRERQKQGRLLEKV
ncbi:hypothetical protein [Alistipes onderdonkii]|uniref:hypothetical protein n=1 Tax=Alistipes onderdonkii TaxID=328813 RepID=UPI0018AC61F6|nr:hypothetical protein [Alistipes onderdonkii]